MPDWVAALHELAEAGTPSVLVTLLAVRGSTPREAGCKMVVTGTATYGTIGGGNLEYQTIAAARALLAGEIRAPAVREFPLGPALGQCCGGHATVLFEPVRPVSWRIALFGAGHVGRALVSLLATLDCRVTWIDPRPDVFPAPLPANVTALSDPDPPAQVAALPAGTCVLVMTHDHALDFGIVSVALSRTELPFIGLIGSETKRARFAARLRRNGMPDNLIARLVCPIGVAGVGGKAPAEIAVAVAAQLLQIRDARASKPPAPGHDSAVSASICTGCGMACCELVEEEGVR
jgi:xanthine dehydrogenase accessory factor